MGHYFLTSPDRNQIGTYEGETPSHALLARFRIGGFGPSVVDIGADGKLVFTDETTRKRLGDETTWAIAPQKLRWRPVVMGWAIYDGERQVAVGRILHDEIVIEPVGATGDTRAWAQTIGEDLAAQMASQARFYAMPPGTKFVKPEASPAQKWSGE